MQGIWHNCLMGTSKIIACQGLQASCYALLGLLPCKYMGALPLPLTQSYFIWVRVAFPD